MNNFKNGCVKCENPNCHTCDKDASMCSDCKENFYGINCASKVEGCAVIQEDDGQCNLCQLTHFMNKTGLCVETDAISSIIWLVGLFTFFYLIN